MHLVFFAVVANIVRIPKIFCLTEQVVRVKKVRSKVTKALSRRDKALGDFD